MGPTGQLAHGPTQYRLVTITMAYGSPITPPDSGHSQPLMLPYSSET
jgi:hypothetical protein